MTVARRIGVFIAAVGLVAVAGAPTASANDQRGPVVTPLASFGDGSFTTGSTIGPDGALYVTDGSAGSVLRIDRGSGQVSTYATGLPTKAFTTDIGGPVDVAFIDGTAYALVTLVSGEITGAGPFGNPNDKNGIYRLEGDGSFTLVADIGAWSVDNPPEPAFFIDTGVQYALETYNGGLLVTDGHHNRLLWVDPNGSINEIATFGNTVPVGLEVGQTRVFISELGPIPHEPEDGRVLSMLPGSDPTVVASGASMLVDVELGNDSLYALSQGQWDGFGEGSPAFPDTGRLVIVSRDGSLTPVVDGTGQELVLDRPTAMEIVGDTAYVVSVVGDVYRIDNL